MKSFVKSPPPKKNEKIKIITNLSISNKVWFTKCSSIPQFLVPGQSVISQLFMPKVNRKRTFFFSLKFVLVTGVITKNFKFIHLGRKKKKKKDVWDRFDIRSLSNQAVSASLPKKCKGQVYGSAGPSIFFCNSHEWVLICACPPLIKWLPVNSNLVGSLKNISAFVASWTIRRDWKLEETEN